jgi:malate dehydrogenase (oxaloacetate-decarboxylating)(NADP+)
MAVTAQETLEYHRRGRPGKIEVTPTKPMLTQRDLSLAYTPGVAEVVLELERTPDTAYEYTAKANLVAVISNGTAILGLGDRGALASKPVMEGKGVLFKRFADVDVFDIEVDTHDPHTVIEVVKAIAPTFGGINLEDIKSPECFFIEKTLQDQLDIPVFHDDQHGTAIIGSAALLNYLEITGKAIEKIKVVFSGAGAAAVATANMFVTVGVPRQNIWMCDIAGLIYNGRKVEMFPEKARFAQGDQPGTLAEALVDADVFVGLSVANIVSQDMIKAMKPQPLILAMANPNPEIKYEDARAARPDAIVCTGRSDYPNQVNNVLGFPFIFRGALDVQARAINEEMKAAAAKALAALAHEDVPDAVLNAYNIHALKFGPDYIIPKPLDPRVMMWVSPAVAEAAMRSGVARKQLNIGEYREQLAERLGSGMRLRRYIINKAKAAPKRIVFPEGEESTILRAAAVICDEAIGQPILIGRADVIQQKVQELGLHFTPQIVDPASDYRAAKYAQAFYELRQRRGLTLSQAQQRTREPNTFGMLMVQQGDADACVAGLAYEYPEVIRPALQIFHTRSGVHKAAGAYIVIAKDNVYIFTDATVNIDPTSEDLAEIALLAADLAEKLNMKPRIALVSFSNFGSAPHPLSNKVRRAVELVRAHRPELAVDGEMQADVAVTPELIETRYPFSKVKNANVLVFPDLEAANVAYKLMRRLGDAQTIGPILLGVGAPVHVLQAGDGVDEVVSIAAVAVIDAQGQL